MAQFKLAQGRLQSLVLASLASVVLFGKNTLSRGDTGREVTATLATVDVILSDKGIARALWTFKLSLLSVCRWMASEKLEGQGLILLSLLGCETLEPLQLDEGLGTVTPASIEHTSDDDDAVDFSSREFLFILNESHSCLHSIRVFLLVELPLAEQ